MILAAMYQLLFALVLFAMGEPTLAIIPLSAAVGLVLGRMLTDL